MPRNVAKPLNHVDTMRARIYMGVLTRREGKPVTLTYVKRDGKESTSTGVVNYFSGVQGMDTHSVTLDTPDKGARTINLHRITKVR
jgi:hypothetical protein